MLIGVTTPEKFYFDEVHYVPAARQMLEPVMPSPMLNPMHPPLAKQLMRTATREMRPDWDLSTPGLREAWDAGDFSKFHGWDRRSPESMPNSYVPEGEG